MAEKKTPVESATRADSYTTPKLTETEGKACGCGGCKKPEDTKKENQ